MFPKLAYVTVVIESLPRLGGGVSGKILKRESRKWSSPPRRGCFSGRSSHGGIPVVFPASAGVFLPGVLPPGLRIRLPRLGGGVSTISPASRARTKSSPPRRGCFRTINARWREFCVFPASAGVFPGRLAVTGYRQSLPRLGGGVSA